MTARARRDPLVWGGVRPCRKCGTMVQARLHVYHGQDSYIRPCVICGNWEHLSYVRFVLEAAQDVLAKRN